MSGWRTSRRQARSQTAGAAIVGGLILAATFVAKVPTTVLGIGSLLFLLGLLLAFVLGYQASRRESSSFGQAIGGGFRTLWRWLWAFMP